MNVVEKLYKNGLSIFQMLAVINKEVTGTSKDKTVINIVEKYQNELLQVCGKELVKGSWAFKYNFMLNTPIQQDIEFKNKYEGVLLKTLYSWGIEGGFFAFGYTCTNNTYPDLIQKNEWAYLEIDKSKETAYFKDQEYRSIKFVLREQLTPDELEEVIKKKELAVIGVESSTVQVEESEIKLDKVQNQAGSNNTRTRETNLRKAIKAALKDMKRKPSLKELVRYFKDKDESGFIIEVTDEQIVWKDTRGNEKGTAITTVGNMLSKESYP